MQIGKPFLSTFLLSSCSPLAKSSTYSYQMLHAVPSSLPSLLHRLLVFCLLLVGLQASSSPLPLRMKSVYPQQTLFYENASIVAIAEPVDSSIEVVIERLGGSKRSVRMKNMGTLFLGEEGRFSLSFRASLGSTLSKNAIEKVCYWC